MTVYTSALAAINYVGADNQADISSTGLTLAKSNRAHLTLASPITPADSTIAAWVKVTNTAGLTSLITYIFCGGNEQAFSDGLWVYGSSTGYPGTVTSLSYRYGATTLSVTIPSTNFAAWQHLIFTNSSGTVTLYLNGVSYAVGTLATPRIVGIGLDAEGSRKSGMSGAGIAVWDSVLGSTDRTWLADSTNRPAPSTGGGGISQLINGGLIRGQVL